ncbi:MAG: AI-2E family transporter [Planctomycetes bacterium]|nr:AI-2E family transporter [Planctomycetota bacterium]
MQRIISAVRSRTDRVAVHHEADERQSDRPRRLRIGPGPWLAILAALVVMVIAKELILPLVLALLLSFLLRPLVRLLARRGMPLPLGSLLVIVALTVGMGLAISGLQRPFTEWMTKLPDAVRHIRERIDDAQGSLKGVDAATKALHSLSEVAGAAPAVSPLEVHSQESGSWMLGAGNAALAVLEVLLMLYFLLSSGDRLLLRYVSLLPGLRYGSTAPDVVMGSYNSKNAAAVVAEIEDMVFTYLATITVINLLVGLAVGLITWTAGVGNPVLWGAMAFLLNYLPYIGPLAGVLIVALASFVTIPDGGQALIAPAAYAGTVLIEGNVLTPLVLGKRLEIHPLVVFVWLLLLGWLWGMAGAILAVPLLMVIKIFSERIRGLGFFPSLIAP